MLFNCRVLMQGNPETERECIREETGKKIPVAMRQGETPVPIPNTMVKPLAADDTVLETVWESRRLPDQKRNNPKGLSIWKKVKAVKEEPPKLLI